MDRNRIGYLAGEGEWLLAEGVRVADVGEDDPLALLLELGRAEVELAAHGVLHLLDVLVQVLVVQPLPPHTGGRVDRSRLVRRGGEDGKGEGGGAMG